MNVIATPAPATFRMNVVWLAGRDKTDGLVRCSDTPVSPLAPLSLRAVVLPAGRLMITPMAQLGTAIVLSPLSELRSVTASPLAVFRIVRGPIDSLPKGRPALTPVMVTWDVAGIGQSLRLQGRSCDRDTACSRAGGCPDPRRAGNRPCAARCDPRAWPADCSRA